MCPYFGKSIFFNVPRMGNFPPDCSFVVRSAPSRPSATVAGFFRFCTAKRVFGGFNSPLADEIPSGRKFVTQELRRNSYIAAQCHWHKGKSTKSLHYLCYCGESASWHFTCVELPSKQRFLIKHEKHGVNFDSRNAPAIRVVGRVCHGVDQPRQLRSGESGECAENRGATP